MIPFSPPRIDQKIIDEVVDTLKSGWITTGPKTKLFERKLMDYSGAKGVFCCNANTNGMELFLRYLGIGPGDEVIVPAYTYCATANVVIHLGATPIMVDVLDDFTIDPKQVKQAISERTKAIMPVDIGGLPANYEALWDVILASKSLFKPNGDAQGKLGRIALVADAAHSIGARVKGELLGRQADAFVYSFHAVKNLTTAEGGAVCFSLPDSFDSSEIYAWLNTRSLHGQSKDALAKTQIGAWEYDVVDAGWKCNMTDLQAAIGLVELERYEQDTLPKRKSIADYYQNYFQIQPWALTPILKDQVRESSYHLYLLRIKGVSRMQRDQIIDRIFAKGVSVNVHYKPLPLLQAYTSRGYEIDDYPITKGLWEQEISLPIFYDMTDGQMKTVVDAVTSSVLEVIN
jgi:dTDP-4-amino-4,6-dideoxygalactose transaminase